jgi:hypothetical protein
MHPAHSRISSPDRPVAAPNSHAARVFSILRWTAGRSQRWQWTV